MSPNEFLNAVLTGVGLYATLLVYVRLVGLRSFAEMTAIDVAVSVAIGSVLASTLLPSKPTYVDGAIILGILFSIQFMASKLRQWSKVSKKIMENSPILVMSGEKVLHQNLKKTLMTEDDLMAKLREANAFDLSRLRAVIFEATGDISVLHGDGRISDRVLESVVGAEDIKSSHSH